jgi:FkbM family methyltransferase
MHRAKICVTGLTKVFPKLEQRLGFISRFFAELRIAPEGRETADILMESLFAAVQCNVISVPLPQSIRQMLTDCAPLRANVATKYSGVTYIADEILCTAHGLRQLDSRIQAYVKERAAIDIGGYDGDSAVVLMDFAKSIHSFEPSPRNFRRLKHRLNMNQRPGVLSEAIQIGLSDRVGSVAFNDSGDYFAHFSQTGEEIVNLTTLDIFWKDRTERIGFIKCDTEGHGLSILKGAQQTLIRHRPVVSFAIYHDYHEFFGIPPLLQKWLVNYNFQWVFGTNSDQKWHECIFLGYPREILEGLAWKVKTN